MKNNRLSRRVFLSEAARMTVVGVGGGVAILSTLSATSQGAGLDFPPPSYARDMGQRVQSAIGGLTDRVQKNNDSISRNRGVIGGAESEKARLQAEMERILADYKKGFFC